MPLFYTDIPTSEDLYAQFKAATDQAERDRLFEAFSVVRDVESALDRAKAQAKWVASAADDVAKANVNTSLNSLGVVQGSGPALDVAVATFTTIRQLAMPRLLALGVVEKN